MTGHLLLWLHMPGTRYAWLQVVLSNDRSGELARGVQAAMEATRLHQVAETIKAVFAPNDAFLLIRLDTAVSTAHCTVLELYTASISRHDSQALETPVCTGAAAQCR